MQEPGSTFVERRKTPPRGPVKISISGNLEADESTEKTVFRPHGHGSPHEAERELMIVQGALRKRPYRILFAAHAITVFGSPRDLNEAATIAAMAINGQL